MTVRGRKLRSWAPLFMLLMLMSADGAWAQTPPTPQFAFLGFIQEATLDTAGTVCTPAHPRLAGGTVTVNGIKMIVPCNSIIQLPAATMTWADLFSAAQATPVGSYIGGATPVPANPVPTGETKTGLALADNPMPFPSFEVSVNGNIVGKNPDGTDRYIVGLIVPVTQQGLNGSSGLVSYIDYTIGAFRVGGINNDPNCATNGITSPSCSGALVQVNDPIGRWGAIHSPDQRFSGDTANSTIHTSTGFPLCIPRVAPPANDPECPLRNRPLNGDVRFPTDSFLPSGAPLKIFDMPTPTAAALDPTLPDPMKQVPMMVGDQVVYAGTLYKINPFLTLPGTVIPDNSAANTYISAHTVEDVLGIFTQPGVPPAYVYVEEMLIGSGGAAVQGILQEASTRMTVVGFTSDPTRLVDIYARDVNPCTGQETLRLLATTDPAADAVKGRFVHRVLGGLFMPPTRNYTVRSRTQAVEATTGQRTDLVAANGILTGEFSLPLFEYIFPENHRLGDPFIPNNYQDFPFLAQGSGPIDGVGSGTAVVGQLSPWPGSPVPTPATCAAGGGTLPVVNAGSDISVGTNAAVTLTGTATFDSTDDATTRTIVWTAPPGVTLTDPSSLVTTFTAPAAPGALTFTLTATDNFGPASDTVNVNVLTPADIVQITVATWATQNGKRGGFGKLNVTATSSDPTAILSLTELGKDGSTTNWGTGSTKGDGTYNWVESKGAPDPSELIVTSSKGGSARTTCSAQDARGRVTCP